jgi:hypothetical protein
MEWGYCVTTSSDDENYCLYPNCKICGPECKEYSYEDDSLPSENSYDTCWPKCKKCGSEYCHDEDVCKLIAPKMMETEGDYWLTTSSDDSYDNRSICKKCGSEYCLEDDCEKYSDPNYIDNMMTDCFGPLKKNIIYRIIPKNHKRIKYKILYELGTTLWK